MRVARQVRRKLTVLAGLMMLFATCTERKELNPTLHTVMAIDPAPVLDIHDGSVEDAAQLLRPVSAKLLSNGNLAVVDIQAPSVLLFDRSGGKVRAYGRRGKGPGEFADPRWVGRCASGDSLFVWDYSRRTIVVLDSAVRFVREYRPAGRPHEFSCSTRGRFLVTDIPDNYIDPGSDVPSMMTQAWIADAEGRRVGVVGEIPLAENRPLGRATRFAVAGDRMYIGTADSAWIDTYDLTGERRGSIAVGVAARTPTALNHARAMEIMLAPISNRAVREHFLPIYEAIPPPAFVPPYVDLFVDPEGLLWAVISTPGDPATRLRAFDEMGEVVADVSLRFDLTVYEVGREHVVGRYDDAYGLPHVVVFRLRRS